MKTSFQSLAALSGCVFFASVVRDVEGVASTITSYVDDTCETAVSVSKSFKALAVTDASGEFTLEEFNECIAVDFGTGTVTGVITVCDAETGEYGLNMYQDDTCTDATFESAALPSCMVIPTFECTGDQVCATNTECTDDEPSTISPNTFNYVATEYTDADCVDPTGNTEVVTADLFIAGFGQGDCVELAGVAWINAECMSDGTLVTQTFASDDNTCSGDVWSEMSASEELLSLCSTIQVGDYYYNSVSCTSDSATVGEGASASTPSPAAMTTDGTTDATPGPVAGVTPDLSDMDTPAPVSSEGGIEVTMSPTPVLRSFEETAAPTIDTETTDGAVRVGNGVAMGMGVTLAMGILVAGMVRSL